LDARVDFDLRFFWCGWLGWIFGIWWSRWHSWGIRFGSGGFECRSGWIQCGFCRFVGGSFWCIRFCRGGGWLGSEWFGWFNRRCGRVFDRW
jgi:hypothetical protein